MKDFNILTIEGIEFNKKELIAKANLLARKNDWEGDFWHFIQQWLNDNNFIEVNTSGSTGKPKTIKILKEKMLISAAMTCAFFKLQKADSALLCISAKHIGGMMMIVRSFYANLNLIIVRPQANPLQNITKEIDFTAMVPYQALKCLETSPSKFQQIKNTIIGGGKVSYELEQLIMKHQISAYSTFGMTETISHIALQKIGTEDYYTCLSNITINKSEEGTLIINAPHLLNNQLKTNDLIELKNNKQFVWLGRNDFAIETGGIKIIPEIIETKLAPFIKARFIISSLPSKEFNNEVILIIEGPEYELDSSIFTCLKKYERPKSIYFIQQLAETSNGKIKRNESSALINLH